MEYLSIAIYLLTMCAIYGVAAIGLNIQFGLAGLANFGVAGFFGIGAYTAGLLARSGYHFVACVIAAALAGALAAAAVGAAISRLRESYWAIATIGLAEVARIVAVNEGWLTGGTFGLEGIPRPFTSLVPDTAYSTFYLLLALGFLGLGIATSQAVKASPLGRGLRVMRESEDLALAMGKSTHALRVKSLMLGSALMAVSGALYAFFVTFISPDDMTLSLTLLIWTMLIVGGKGNVWGTVLGVLLIVSLYNSTRYIKDFVPIGSDTLASARMVVIGLLLIIMMIKRPQGVVPESRQAFP